MSMMESVACLLFVFAFCIFSNSFDTTDRRLNGPLSVLFRGSFSFLKRVMSANSKFSRDVSISKDSFRRFCKVLTITS